MKSGYKEIEHLMYLKVEDKLILVVGDKWKGSPLIGCKVDMLMISKNVKERYNKSIFPHVLKDTKVVYI